ncbi:kinase-like domain-containing protein [Pilaira anomala]|nr:kinase-like domain-containing protein [Pilaira anomala]
MSDQKVLCRATTVPFGTTFRQECASNSTDPSVEGTVYFTPEETESDSKALKRTDREEGDTTPDLRRKQTKIEETPSGRTNAITTRNLAPIQRSSRTPPPLTPEQLAFRVVEPDWNANHHCFAYLQSMNPAYKNKYLEKRKGMDATRTGYIIGRGSDCDVQINSGEPLNISRNHCLIYMETGSNGVAKGIRIYLEDQSINGTFVNGNKIGKNNRVLLKGGDVIQLFRRNGWAENDFRHSFYRIRFPPAFAANECSSQYNFISELGSGNFATVYHAISRATNLPVAIKVITKAKYQNKPKLLKSTVTEMGIMMAIEKHPFLLQLIEIFNETTQIYLVLEYIRDGELFNLIQSKRKFTEDETRFIFWQLFTATEYLHASGIAHRDLKPENVLLADKENLHVKISDFGLAKNEDRNGTFDSQCGTPNYVAPEILNPTGTRSYDKQCDMWSLGVILYICLCGFPPFSDETAPPSMKTQIKMGKFDFPSPYWDDISKEAKELISALLIVDPFKRATVSDALEMPWMKLNQEDFQSRLATFDPEILMKVKQLSSREQLPATQLAASQSLPSSFYSL